MLLKTNYTVNGYDNQEHSPQTTFLTDLDALGLLGVKEGTVKTLREQGEIVAVHIGNEFMFPSYTDELMEDCQ